MTYKIRVDIVKNRLYVTLVGFPSLDEMQRCGDETIEATRRLRPGYDIITDITEFKAGGPDVAKDIERIQAHFGVRIAKKIPKTVKDNNIKASPARGTEIPASDGMRSNI